MLPIELLLGRSPRRVGRPPARVPVAPPPPPPEPEPEAEEIIKHPRKSQAMPQVSISLEDTVIEEADKRAAQVGLSRSKWLSNLIVNALYTSQQTDYEVEKMNLEVQHLQELLAERDIRLQELHGYRVHLEGQLARLMAERDRLLPEPRAGFWARLFGRD